ncbi:MAG: hypothetical protein K1X44_06065 [Alphaproteobacteria bacterium]|nr:hypothetical protein [Alphaproteobacteria bacterium]
MSLNYNPDLALKYCLRIIQGENLRTLCDDDGNPISFDQLACWLLKEKEFYDMYKKARALQADLLVDDMLDLVKKVKDSNLHDENTSLKPSQKLTYTKMVLSTYKWAASKFNPEKFGSIKKQPKISTFIPPDLIPTLDHQNALDQNDKNSFIYSIFDPHHPYHTETA